MTASEILYELQTRASKDEALKQRFLATRQAENPLEAFCQVCAEEGCEIAPMEIIIAGEEAYAAMKRSTNGGGANSPTLQYEDDAYELFLAAL